MRIPCVPPRRAILFAAVLVVSAGAALAQQPAASSHPTSGTDRLFISFAEDATIVDSQWWEGQLDFAHLDNGTDAVIGRLVAAFQPWKDWELGGRVGFGNTDAPTPPPPAVARDGSGATDLDFWVKYYWAMENDVEIVAGGLLTVPTGDESAQLGNDAFALAVFGSARWKLDHVILSGNVGVRANADGRPGGATCAGGADCDGKISPFVGGGVLYPVSDKITLSGEAFFESKRFEGYKSAAGVAGGLTWHATRRGMLRVAVEFGVTDAAPDYRTLISWAASF